MNINKNELIYRKNIQGLIELGKTNQDKIYNGQKLSLQTTKEANYGSFARSGCM